MALLPTDTVVFNLDYYEQVLVTAKRAGYKFKTMSQFIDAGCPGGGHIVLRHDLDKKPGTLPAMLAREERQGICSTLYVLVTTNEYNLFDHRTYPMVRRAIAAGHEVGLHSNFVEFARFHGLDPMEALAAELQAARAFFPSIRGLACHRDFNYLHNSLPWVEQNWERIQHELGLAYQAYDPKIMDNMIFVNETVNPRLGWRHRPPEEAIATGRSICMSTHPHWWFEEHPFEV